MVTERSCPSAVVKRAGSRLLPVVSLEWLVQSLIVGERQNYDSDPQYCHDYDLWTIDPSPQTSHHHHPSMVSSPTQHQLLFWMCSPVSWRGNSPADLESVHVFSSVVHCDGMRSWRPDPRHALLFREPSCERALRWWWWSMSLMYIVLTCLFLCSNKLWSVSFLPFWCLIHCSHLFSHNWRTRHYFVNIFTIHTTWSNGNCTSCCEIGVTVKGWTSMAVDSEGTLYEIMAHWRSSGVMTTEEHCLYLQLGDKVLQLCHPITRYTTEQEG